MLLARSGTNVRTRRLFPAFNIVTQSGSGRISVAYARYAVVLFALINIVNYLDRNVIFVLFEPIKRDLGLTDTQLGWLGAAFVIVFSLAANTVGNPQRPQVTACRHRGWRDGLERVYRTRWADP